MSKKPNKNQRRKHRRMPPQEGTLLLPSKPLPREAYERAADAALAGNHDSARQSYETILPTTDIALGALVCNDLAVLAAVAGDYDRARARLGEALDRDPWCGPALANRAFLDAERQSIPTGERTTEAMTVWPDLSKSVVASQPPIKVVILSFLFNWPSTGGGIVHTVELGKFLAGAGYSVRHIYAHYAPWGIGEVRDPVPFPSVPLEFDRAGWTREAIQDRYRAAVESFDPDYAIITDSWNIKPLLAEAVFRYPYILRQQAMECLCPLNNVRLLPEPDGRARQCPLHQLATPSECARCVQERGHFSGDLHKAERALSGVGTEGYHERLLRAFRGAEAVLLVNPLTEAMVGPYCRETRVVTAGMDPARFPWPLPVPPSSDGRVRILFAGLVDEWMKGFRVLHEACRILWENRQDFELVATADPPGPRAPFTRFVGWQSQESLPAYLYAADILVVPTVAQEALGRTAVEAMAAGRPVVASRLGGLPFTVADGATGLQFEPGDARDLASKLEALLDDPALRERLGLAGRKRFEEHYAWPVIIERHYRSLLCRRRERRG
jgi:glycosyltransferase involved in cell wall biosynthesis